MSLGKRILRWFFVVFFVAGGVVCASDYGKPLVGILWLWTAIFVSPLPIRLVDTLNLKISERVCNAVMWGFVILSIAALMMIV